MSNSIDTSISSGWSAESDPAPEADEVEFLKWFFQHSDPEARGALIRSYMAKEQKALPQHLLALL